MVPMVSMVIRVTMWTTLAMARRMMVMELLTTVVKMTVNGSEDASQWHV